MEIINAFDHTATHQFQPYSSPSLPIPLPPTSPPSPPLLSFSSTRRPLLIPCKHIQRKPLFPYTLYLQVFLLPPLWTHHYRQASKSPKWSHAMNAELQALSNQPCLVVINKAISLGCNQKEGLNYYDTFCPVVRATTIKMVLSIATSHSWTI